MVWRLGKGAWYALGGDLEGFKLGILGVVVSEMFLS